MDWIFNLVRMMWKSKLSHIIIYLFCVCFPRLSTKQWPISIRNLPGTRSSPALSPPFNPPKTLYYHILTYHVDFCKGLFKGALPIFRPFSVPSPPSPYQIHTVHFLTNFPSVIKLPAHSRQCPVDRNLVASQPFCEKRKRDAAWRPGGVRVTPSFASACDAPAVRAGGTDGRQNWFITNILIMTPPPPFPSS